MKHKSTKARHSVAAGFPGMGSPMDVADHPVHNLPSPAAGALDPAQLMTPGAPLAPGEQL